jgi:Icc-related predicted phosphoesterase
MRIVALADTHLFHRDLRVPDGDVLIHAGDFCRQGDLAEVALAMKWFGDLPHERKILVAGNHDRAFQTDATAARALVPPGVAYLQDEAVTIDGVHFYGSPWTPTFMDWAFLADPGAELAAIWAQIPADVDVLVTHGPPFGHGDSSSTEGRYGDKDLLARIRQLQPPLHLFGHIHEGGGATHEGKTACVNVTAWECERSATTVTFDPRTRKLVLELIPPREESHIVVRGR